MSFSITSPAFGHKQTIPGEHTCDNADTSPQLILENLPAKAVSVTIIMDDPDAPPGTWIHWTLYNWPTTTTILNAGLAKDETLENGAKQGAVWGVDRFTRVGYWGPCPPPGKPHRYSFRAYALDTMLTVAAKPDKTALLTAMKGHILAQTELIGMYGR